MRVAFSAGALTDPSASRYLTALWWLMEDGRHVWVVPDLDAVLDSPWLKEHGPLTGTAVVATAKNAARRAQEPEVIVEASAFAGPCWSGRWRVGAPRASWWLHRPVVVVVENGAVDGSFLRVVALRVGETALRRRLGTEAFARLKQRWRSALGDGETIEVRHGGGSTTAMVLELAVEADPELPPRLMVVVDSDRVSAGAPVGSTADKVLATCEELPKFGCGWRPTTWVSKKREVENYLPFDAIRAVMANASAPTDPDYQDFKVLYGRSIAQEVFRRADDRLHSAALREHRELDDLVRQLIALL